MTLYALQLFLAHACKCQVMLSTVWFPLNRPKRSRPEERMNTEEEKASVEVLMCLSPREWM